MWYRILGGSRAGRDIRETTLLQIVRTGLPPEWDRLVVVGPDLREAIDPAQLRDWLLDVEAGFVFLVPRKEPPSVAFRPDPPLHSFACAGPAVEALRSLKDKSRLAGVFDAFQAVMSARRPVAISAREVPFGQQRSARPARPAEAVDCVIPHRGSARRLDACLHSVAHAISRHGHGRIHVGVDDAPSPETARVLRRHGIAGQYASHPGSGPYPIRNALVRAARSRWICFQDSDDLACVDRIAELRARFSAVNIGMVGSHELRIDEETRRVTPVRYPLRASEALGRYGLQTLLHPTSMVNRRLFLKCGGFSTHGKVAMDTQFLYRSFFHFESHNVDKFLYVRITHKDSLTQKAATGMRSLYRARLSRTWRSDFLRAVVGDIALQESGLALQSGEASYRLMEETGGRAHSDRNSGEPTS